MNSDTSKATATSDSTKLFRIIVGEENVFPATADDNVDGVSASTVVEPANATEVAQVLQAANVGGLCVLARGAGTKLAWGSPPRSADVILSMRRLNRVIQHAWSDMTVAVEAGCTVGELQRTLALHGQRLALDPLWPERATIGGILATNDSGSLRVRFGSLRDLIIGSTVALADGTLAMSGGRVVKNVAGYDLSKLMTGSLGTLGVITEAIFRLYPLPRAVRTVSFQTNDAARLCALLLAILDSQVVSTGLQLRCGSQGDSHLDVSHLDVRLEGTHEGIDAQLSRLRTVAGNAPALKFTDNVTEEDVWAAREALFQEPGDATLVTKIMIQPADVLELINLLQDVAKLRVISWQLAAQGAGTAWLRVDGSIGNLSDVLDSLRMGLRPLGSGAVVQQCPAAIKRELDVWGPVGDSLDLMRMVKKQFDPLGILNPGRFVGGI